jgi:catechol 2,3-dioxygenase-like lactoylglutathione lyase family enzyme
VLYVRNVERSVDFYRNVLGFHTVSQFPKAAFLQAADSTNDHDLGLFDIGDQAADSPAGQTSVGLYHLAWEVDTMGEFERIGQTLSDSAALVGASNHGTTKSWYAKDPDGIEFEIAWIIPAHLITDADRAGSAGVQPLDLATEIARFGREELSCNGISAPAETDFTPRPVLGSHLRGILRP